MKRKNIFAIIALLILSACSQDFLEVDPKGRISSDDFLTNQEEAEMALWGVYDLMTWNYNRDWHSAFFLKVLPGDDANAAGSGPADQKQLQEIDDFTQVADNSSIEQIWSGYYQTISAANTVINRLSEGDLTGVDDLIAEAKAIRAFNYFELVVLFGDVPLILDSPETEADMHKSRTPKADIYAQIEADLTDAISELPLKSEYSEADKFRISKGTAQSVLGKAYLYQEKWGEAVSQFGDVISSQEYDLLEDFEQVWRVSSEFGAESILELQYISSEQYDWSNFPWGGNVESNIHVQLMGPRGDGIFDVAAIGISNGWGFNLPTEDVANAFEEAGDIIRRDATLISEEDLVAAGGGVNEPEGGFHDYEGYVRLKYVTRPDETAGSIKELNYAVNWRLIRYADVLLMAAEAYYRDGAEASALTELNKVRDRAGLEDVDASGSALFDAIVTERRLELAFEGQRFWDVVRWGIAGQELSDTQFTSGKNEVFPIPQREVNVNENITPDDQNPGY
jgi:hypothetical protein